MRSAHTDAQLLLATQIAYIDIPPGQNVSRWIAENYERYRNSGNKKKMRQADAMKNVLDMVNNPEFKAEGWTEWTIRDSWDFNHGSGMYASLIDTGRGDAIIGFRGSESYDLEQGIKDWVIADVGLLNSVLTEQQADTQIVMELIYSKYGNEYNSFDVTGHSLGGNLAEHAVITASEYMRDKIGRAVSFDGPGFSNEYLIAHAAQIKAVSDKLDHYAWSWVGSLLLPIPGSHYQIIDADYPSDKKGINRALWRHDTRNVKIQDGHIQPGKRDPLARFASRFSKKIEMSFTDPFAVLLGLESYYSETMDRIIDRIINRYNRMSNARGEFSADTGAVYEAAGQLTDYAGRTSLLAEEINSIAGGIKYYSLTGYMLKNTLRAVARGIAGDCSRASKLSAAVSGCGDNYISTDSQAADLLTIR